MFQPVDPKIKSLLARYGDPGDALFIVASSASMSPFFKDGDILTVQTGIIEDVDVGEIVLFRRQGLVVAHRCIRRAGPGAWVLCGDALFAADGEISASEMLGRACGSLRNGSYVFLRGLRGRSVGKAAAFLSRSALACRDRLRGAFRIRGWAMKALAAALGRG